MTYFIAPNVYLGTKKTCILQRGNVNLLFCCREIFSGVFIAAYFAFGSAEMYMRARKQKPCPKNY